MRNLLLMSLFLLAACNRPEPSLPANSLDISWRFDRGGADFRLSDANGKARSLADFRGKVVVLFFGYTHCPEVCPTTLATLARVMRTLGPAAENVQVLFVTLDPERDTPDVLAQYVPSFDPSFVGLYGDAQATAEAARVFAVSYEKHPEKGGDYTLDHSVGTYLIGRSGKVVLMSPYGQRDELLVQDIKLLLDRPR
ncbi:MAG: SCO family protein [Steroidobacterales bacterium]